MGSFLNVIGMHFHCDISFLQQVLRISVVGSTQRICLKKYSESSTKEDKKVEGRSEGLGILAILDFLDSQTIYKR